MNIQYKETVVYTLNSCNLYDYKLFAYLFEGQCLETHDSFYALHELY